MLYALTFDIVLETHMLFAHSDLLCAIRINRASCYAKEINTGCECVRSDLLLIADFQRERSWYVRCVRCPPCTRTSYNVLWKFTPATTAGSRSGCIVGQGRFTVDMQTGHARLGTPLRLAVKLFEAKSTTWQAAAFPVPSACRQGEMRLPNAIRHGHVYAFHYTSLKAFVTIFQIYSDTAL